MNTVSNQKLSRSQVFFTVTIPGLTRKDIPELDENGTAHIEGSTDCSSYAYKFESAPAKKDAQRYSSEYASYQYLMFILYLAAQYFVHDVFITYNDDNNTVSFELDFGTEYEDHAERFYRYLFLKCNTI